VSTASTGRSVLPLNPAFEYAALVAQGEASIDGHKLAPGTLLDLGTRRQRCTIHMAGPARLLLLGGEPLQEAPLMWWNFVARTKQELTQACRDWNSEQGYLGRVDGYDGARLVAPLPPWVTTV